MEHLKTGRSAAVRSHATRSRRATIYISGLCLLLCLFSLQPAHAQESLCATGTKETGTLTRSNYYQFLPARSYYIGEGLQQGCISGPPGTNFQLWLYEWNAVDRRWTVVERAENPGSSESISYPANGGYYIWVVYTVDGEGEFEFTLNNGAEYTEPACLASANVVDDWAGQDIVGRIRPGDVGDGMAIDLRGTRIRVHDKSEDAVVNGRPVIDSRWGLVQTDSSTDLCIVGGEVSSNNAHNITWSENYDTAGIGRGYRLGTTRNHVAIDLGDALRPTVSGLYFFNLHDGVRFNGAQDWRFEHSWGEYTRDDCIENDEMASGVIYDVLLDGCYVGYSNRATSLTNDQGQAITGLDKTVTFDKVLLRMEMMPGPYDACGRPHWYFDNRRQPYTSTPCIERDAYGTGNLFKLYDQGDETGSINPTFNFIDSFFVVEQVRDSSREDRADFPPANKIGTCENVTIVYLGEGPYPGRLPPEGCYTLYDEEDREIGLSLWKETVADWHARHPELAAQRKNALVYGDVSFPRPGFNESER